MSALQPKRVSRFYFFKWPSSAIIILKFISNKYNLIVFEIYFLLQESFHSTPGLRFSRELRNVLFPISNRTNLERKWPWFNLGEQLDCCCTNVLWDTEHWCKHNHMVRTQSYRTRNSSKFSKLVFWSFVGIKCVTQVIWTTWLILSLCFYVALGSNDS